MRLVARWPQTGEGRAIKAATENITRRLDSQQPLRDIDLAFRELTTSADELSAVLENPFFKSTLSSLPYRSGDDISVRLEGHIRQVISNIHLYIRDYFASLPPPPTATEKLVSDVAKIVPEQKIGPVKFEFVAGTLKVLHQRSIAQAGDTHNAESARRELVASAARIVAFLDESNHDRRLRAIISDMKSRLEEKQDIIQLGISAITCQMVCEHLEDELPNI